MKISWRLIEDKKASEMQKIYLMLAGYPIILIIVAILIPYIGSATAVFIYIIYLVYIIFRLQKIANLAIES